MRKGFSFTLLGVSAIALIVAVVASCTKDKTPIIVIDPNPVLCADTVHFSSQIEPMMIANCSTSGCHDASAQGGYNLLGYSNISDPTNASRIINVINYAPGSVPMPQGAPQLNDSLIQQFECWVAQGRLNN
jgi:hypothetical protein